MSYSAESSRMPSTEVIMVDGQPIEIMNFVGEGLAETVSNLRRLTPPASEEAPDLPEAA